MRGDRILNPEDIIPGEEYFLSYGQEGHTISVIVICPLFQVEGEWYVKITFTENGLILDVPLTDIGILPFPDGSYHTVEHLREI